MSQYQYPLGVPLSIPPGCPTHSEDALLCRPLFDPEKCLGTGGAQPSSRWVRLTRASVIGEMEEGVVIRIKLSGGCTNVLMRKKEDCDDCEEGLDIVNSVVTSIS